MEEHVQDNVAHIDSCGHSVCRECVRNYVAFKTKGKPIPRVVSRVYDGAKGRARWCVIYLYHCFDTIMLTQRFSGYKTVLFSK